MSSFFSLTVTERKQASKRNRVLARAWASALSNLDSGCNSETKYDPISSSRQGRSALKLAGTASRRFRVGSLHSGLRAAPRLAAVPDDGARTARVRSVTPVCDQGVLRPHRLSAPSTARGKQPTEAGSRVRGRICRDNGGFTTVVSHSDAVEGTQLQKISHN